MDMKQFNIAVFVLCGLLLFCVGSARAIEPIADRPGLSGLALGPLFISASPNTATMEPGRKLIDSLYARSGPESSMMPGPAAEVAHRLAPSRAQLSLPSSQAKLLDREGNQYRVEVLYLFKAGQNHSVAPSINYGRADQDVTAIGNDRFGVGLTHTYQVKQFSLVTNVGYAYLSYDRRNSINNKAQKDYSYSGSFTVSYDQPFKIEGLSLTGTALAFQDGANISLYKQTLTGGMLLSASYRF
jgi:hypothetical protein